MRVLGKEDTIHGQRSRFTGLFSHRKATFDPAFERTAKFAIWKFCKQIDLRLNISCFPENTTYEQNFIVLFLHFISNKKRIRRMERAEERWTYEVISIN